MTANIQQFIFAAIRSAVLERKLSEDERALFSKDKLSEYYALAKKHDMAHLVAYAIKGNGLLEAQNPAIESSVMTAVLRYEQLKYELDRACSALEAAGIDFMPLKGSVLRSYYPEPWMRTSCDIDILVHESELDTATELLCQKLGYQFDTKGEHDVSLYLSDRIHLELHYALMADGIAMESSAVLKEIWQHAKPKEGFSHWHELSDEAFYFYHIAHMAKHFEEGGCGIRPLIDLYILDHLPTRNQEARELLLEKGKLLKFTKTAQKLSRVWLEGEAPDALSQKAELYILNGGVYGNIENLITIQQQKKGGRLRYAFSKIFLPYSIIKFHYPILQKHPWLLPFMEIRRWCKLIFCGHAKRSLHVLKLNQNLSKEEALATQDFLNDIGL